MNNARKQIFNLNSIINDNINNKLNNLHTAAPATILSFNPETQTATVQPSFSREFLQFDGSEETTVSLKSPVIENVPVCYPRGGGFSITFPVKSGDECLLIYTERSLDNWHSKGGEGLPISTRKHDLSDAVALVGVSSGPNKIANYDNEKFTIKSDSDDVVLSIDEQGNLAINATESVIIECRNAIVNASTSCTIDSPETQITGNTQINGNLVVDGDISGASVETTAGDVKTLKGVSLDNHIHGSSPPPTPD